MDFRKFRNRVAGFFLVLNSSEYAPVGVND